MASNPFNLAIWSVWMNTAAFILIRLYWGPCPLSMLEDALKTGSEQADSYRWRKLRDRMSYDGTCWWLLIHTLSIWTVLQIVGVVVCIIKG